MTDRATVYLVRHAKAGERRGFSEPDELRPLSNAGRKQATAIADRLEPKAAGKLLASPFLRCIQTLEALAERLGAGVDTDIRLAEGGAFESVLELLHEVPDGSVLCSHGDVIPATIQALHRRGMELQTPPDWHKSTIWVLRRKDARFTKGKVWRP
jgi:phosphohistidine phosphatase SixA